jgi:transposase
VAKTYRPYEPTQSFLLPPSPLEWLPKDHLAYFVLDLVRSVDMSAITSHYEREARGYPPYHPTMMLSLLVYGYCVGTRSSREIEKKTHEDVAFRVLAGGQHPDHSRISEFRRIHLDAFAKLFVEILRLCQEAGLVKLGHVALDGTKVKANASKHKAMSFDRMKKEEARLKKLVDEMLESAEDVDAEEDRLYGKDKRGDEIVDPLLRDPKTRMERIKQLRRELEAEAKRQQAEAKDRDDDEPPTPGNTALPEHKIPTDKKGKPTDKSQRNFTDADSRIMKAGGDYVQAYNCQLAVDEEHQIIVGQAVTNQPPDVEHLAPMIEEVAANCGELPSKMTADAGYYSAANVIYATEQGIDIYIPTERWRHGEAPPTVRGRPPADMTLKEEMTRKLRTRRGREVYSRRKTIVEPAFGQIKGARGIREFLLRGLAKVRAEWTLITATHNVLKLYRAQLV